MPKYLIILISLISFASLAQDFSLYEKKEYTNSNGKKLRYRILYPPNYDRSKKYPLVLFLHGAGERGEDNEKQLTHGAKLFIDSINRTKYPAIVLFPQCPLIGYWSSVIIDRTISPLGLRFDYSRSASVDLAIAIELVKHVKKKESVDVSRVYITGLSMGGMGTFEAVYRYPKLFAAAVPICGGGDTVRYDKRVLPVHFRIFHGDQDSTIGVKESRSMVAKLKSLNTTVVYKEYIGVYHNSWNNAFAEPDFMSWIFGQKRK